jgi:hypothetical protein
MQPSVRCNRCGTCCGTWRKSISFSRERVLATTAPEMKAISQSFTELQRCAKGHEIPVEMVSQIWSSASRGREDKDVEVEDARCDGERDC